MRIIRELIEAIRDLTAAVNALRRAIAGGSITPNGSGGPGEEGNG
jgi:hypothetical protein